MRFSSKSRATCFYCISLDLLICIIFCGDQITCRCWGRQSADARHARSKSDATNLHGSGASNLTDNNKLEAKYGRAKKPMQEQAEIKPAEVNKVTDQTESDSGTGRSADELRERLNFIKRFI